MFSAKILTEIKNGRFISKGNLRKLFLSYQTRINAAMVEIVVNHQYDLYDDTGASLEEIEDSTEPMRNPDMKPWWKED